MAMSQAMRAFLYARVSTKDKGQDAENQVPDMRKFARDRDWELRREFVDNASAFRKVTREQFDEMFAAAERRETDVILIWALDRFCCEGPLKTMLLLDRLSRSGVRVKSMKEPWLDPDSPTYDLLLPIFAWIAKQERMRIGERVRAGMTNAKALLKQGKPTQKGKTRWAGRPRVDVDVARIGTYRAHGWSLRRIAAKVGVSEGSVRNALKSPRIVRKKPVKKGVRF